MSSLTNPSKIAELVESAPDWASVDPLSAEVRTWLDRVCETVREVDPLHAAVLRVHAEHLREGNTQVLSAEIMDTLQCVAWREGKRKRG